MTKRLLSAMPLAALVLTMGAAPSTAQSSAMDGIRAEFAAVTKSVMTAANKAPESLYGYQPTPEVFTLRKQFLHIADAAYSICAGFKGTPGQRPKMDADAALPKAEVIAALTAAFGGLLVFAGNAHTGVPHLEQQHVLAVTQPQQHTALARVLEGVGQQVAQDAPQHHRIGPDHGRTGMGAQADRLARGHRRKLQRQIGEQLLDVHVLETDLVVAGIDARQVEQRVEQLVDRPGGLQDAR